MKFVLFCKSYEGDLLRFQRLWESIQLFNKDQIEFYASVPAKDLTLFQSHIKDHVKKIHWVSDEEIVSSNPIVSLDFYLNWDGRLSQQVIKAEFWRYLEKIGQECLAYLCIDSESIFIRDFFYSDFIADDGVPYTVIHQNKDLLQLAENKNIKKVSDHFHAECAMMKEVFSRVGLNYDFGPTPVIWATQVWKDLDNNYLQPKQLNIWDAINLKPSELKWYGEALLHFKSIPLYPIEPLFRVYHYDWQFFYQLSQGDCVDTLCGNYLGVLRQSNWEYEFDYGAHAKRKSWMSRALRGIKRYLSRFR